MNDLEPNGGTTEPAEDLKTEAAFARTNLPGICLIIVGALNLILGSLMIVRGFQLTDRPAKEVFEEVSPTTYQEIVKQGLDPEEVKDYMVRLIFGWGVLAIILSVWTVTAGMFMRTLRNYRFTLIGAVVTTIPILSPLACLAIGVFVGVWAVLVLLRPEVKTAFF